MLNHVENWWKKCVPTAGWMVQTFPPSWWIVRYACKLCKTSLVLPRRFDNSSHTLSTTPLTNFTTITTQLFHTFHRHYYYDYERIY